METREPEMNTAPEGLVQKMVRRAHDFPERRAVVFLDDNGNEVQAVTYGGLDQRARALASVLQRHGLRGRRAILLYAHDLDFITAFVACLYVGVIAVPVPPPDPNRLDRSLPRMTGIVLNASASAVLTAEAMLGAVRPYVSRIPDLTNLVWIPTDAADAVGDEIATPFEAAGDSPAFLQYTAGSTGEPKGIVVTRRNLHSNLDLIRRKYRLNNHGTMSSWLPFFHDMGLVGAVLANLYTGYTGYFMSPLTFLRNPMVWLETMSRYKCSVGVAPNFGYDLCVKRINEADRLKLDLSHWTTAISGAEPVRWATLENFAKAFAPAGFDKSAFAPSYGMAEATLLATVDTGQDRPFAISVDKHELSTGRVQITGDGADTGQILVRCGAADDIDSIVIVDPSTGLPREPGCVGEIWVCGDSVAEGYWRGAESTAKTFGHTLAQHPGVTYLRTGDLGVIVDRGLYVTGRINDLIVVDGRNHYPQDIERTAEDAHSAVRRGCAAAFSVDGGDSERLVVVAELDPKATVEVSQVAASIKSEVSRSYGIRVHDVLVVKRGALHKTSSGKIQRSACRRSYLDNAFDKAEEVSK